MSNSLYIVDERSVALAIIARGAVRATVAEPGLRNELDVSSLIRAFRPDHRARSFRLERAGASRHYRR